MTKDSKRNYLNAKTRARKNMIKANIIFVLVGSVLLFLGTLNIVFMIVFMIYLMFGGAIVYGINVHKGGLRHFYDIYFHDLIDDLAEKDKIVVKDTEISDFLEDEIKHLFYKTQNLSVSGSASFVIDIEGVTITAGIVRVFDLDSQDLTPLFAGTCLKMKETKLMNQYVDEETNSYLAEDETFIEDIRGYFGKDVVMLKEGDYLYLAFREQLPLHQRLSNNPKKYASNTVMFYDDLESVISSWKKFKEIKRLIIR